VLGKTRSAASVITGNDEREQTLNQLLAQMDGFDTSKGVMILAATNRPEILDPALLRPRRFDRKVVIDRPDVRGREQILRVHVRGVTLDPAVDLGVIAARTVGLVGADLANLVNEAALLAARAGKDAVDTNDFDEAIDRVVAGLQRKSRVMNPREKEIVAHHEAGHALIAEFRPKADRVAKISIIPRGVAALGYTQQQPTEDRYLLTRGELLDRLDVMLGGRTAEELLCGDEDTARAVDREVRTLLDAAHQRVPFTLEQHKPALCALAARQIETEVVDRKMFAWILAEAAADPPRVPVTRAASAVASATEALDAHA